MLTSYLPFVWQTCFEASLRFIFLLWAGCPQKLPLSPLSSLFKTPACFLSDLPKDTVPPSDPLAQASCHCTIHQQSIHLASKTGSIRRSSAVAPAQLVQWAQWVQMVQSEHQMVQSPRLMCEHRAGTLVPWHPHQVPVRVHFKLTDLGYTCPSVVPAQLYLPCEQLL